MPGAVIVSGSNRSGVPDPRKIATSSELLPLVSRFSLLGRSDRGGGPRSSFVEHIKKKYIKRKNVANL